MCARPEKHIAIKTWDTITIILISGFPVYKMYIGSLIYLLKKLSENNVIKIMKEIIHIIQDTNRVIFMSLSSTSISD